MLRRRSERRNIGHDVNAPLTRVYATPLAQPVHTDSADMVALLSLRLSKEGGLSSWSSSVSVHNELLRLGRKVVTEHSAPRCGSMAGGLHPTARQSYLRLVSTRRALPCMPTCFLWTGVDGRLLHKDVSQVSLHPQI